MDGMRHVAVFLTRGEKDVLRANKESAEVIMNNCIRCHTQLNTEFVNTGRIDYMMSQVGEGKLVGTVIGTYRMAEATVLPPPLTH